MEAGISTTSGQRHRAAESAVLTATSLERLAEALAALTDGPPSPDDGGRRAAAALAARDLERHLDVLSDSGDHADDVVVRVEDVIARLRRAAAG